MRPYSVLFYFLLLVLPAGAQSVRTLSPGAQASLMTVAPGAELYSTFGHSALRIRDVENRIDRIYNYGTFDFDQPNFYLNFCRGKLLYMLDREPYRSFEQGNILDHRWMKEQSLQLTPEQVQTLFTTLEINALPENRNYKYDFFYDNCASRIRDITRRSLQGQVTFDSSTMKPGITMRQLLRPYLVQHPWTQFGIDLVLGMPTDKKADLEKFVFLPDNLHDAFAGAKHANGLPLVQSEIKIPEFDFPAEPLPTPWSGPLVAMILVGVIGLLSLLNPRAERIFDTVFWLLIGVAGLIITFLWFFTEHQATKNNLNFFWALPTHLFFFWKYRPTTFRKVYFGITAFLAVLVLVLWNFLPQELPVAALPLVVLVAVKGYRRGK